MYHRHSSRVVREEIVRPVDDDCILVSVFIVSLISPDYRYQLPLILRHYDRLKIEPFFLLLFFQRAPTQSKFSSLFLSFGNARTSFSKKPRQKIITTTTIALNNNNVQRHRINHRARFRDVRLRPIEQIPPRAQSLAQRRFSFSRSENNTRSREETTRRRRLETRREQRDFRTQRETEN